MIEPERPPTCPEILFLVTLSFAIVLGLLLSGCTPSAVYRDKIVDVPVVQKCKITLPTFPVLPTDQPIPGGMSSPEKRKWMLAALYRDIVLQKGELEALEKLATSCQ